MTPICAPGTTPVQPHADGVVRHCANVTLTCTTCDVTHTYCHLDLVAFAAAVEALRANRPWSCQSEAQP